MPVARHALLIIQQAALVQLALVAFAVLVVALLLAPEGRRRLCGTAARMAANRLRRTRRAARVADLRRYAEEVAVAAQRAATTAERRHQEWVEAQRNREQAWRAYEAADTAARKATEAAAYVALESPGTTEDVVASRQRVLVAAMEAYRRGELTARQLQDIAAHRDGWDLELHPCELEARLLRTIRRHLLADYRKASQIERAARHAADTAAAAKRSLQDEAFAAAERARQVGTVRVPLPRTSPELEASQPIQLVTAAGSGDR